MKNLMEDKQQKQRFIGVWSVRMSKDFPWRTDREFWCNLKKKKKIEFLGSKSDYFSSDVLFRKKHSILLFLENVL